MQSRGPTLVKKETDDSGDEPVSEESISVDDSSDDKKSLDEIIDAYAESSTKTSPKSSK
ncbi:hypothetical protein [Halorubrum distributum]|uniref:hypothetical protein n=1 Tax=Halorubrum distributum TaxID=29283 RepID=UPI00137585E6|nr:hypothetical protein [Halorubrum arcis]